MENGPDTMGHMDPGWGSLKYPIGLRFKSRGSGAAVRPDPLSILTSLLLLMTVMMALCFSTPLVCWALAKEFRAEMTCENLGYTN